MSDHREISRYCVLALSEVVDRDDRHDSFEAEADHVR
jgi:hypothetical protein